MIDESDQASLCGSIFSSHLLNHTDNKPDPNCLFCKNFIIPEDEPKTYPLESYTFMIFDISDKSE